MTISAFIGNIEWITLPMPTCGATYPGFCAYCRFDTDAYCDGLYHDLGVPLSAELVRSVPKRRAEYLAGRYLARHVLEKLGVGQFTLLNGQDRSPIWPDNLCGSLSHNRDSALCAVHHQTDVLRGVGVDVETIMNAERAISLWPGIVDEEENHGLQACGLPFFEALTLSFSAKESLFKALYPRVRQYFDFLDAKMTLLDKNKQLFELELQTTLTPELLTGIRFRGAYQRVENKITTFLCC